MGVISESICRKDYFLANSLCVYVKLNFSRRIVFHWRFLFVTEAQCYRANISGSEVSRVEFEKFFYILNAMHEVFLNLLEPEHLIC